MSYPMSKNFPQYLNELDRKPNIFPQELVDYKRRTDRFVKEHYEMLVLNMEMQDLLNAWLARGDLSDVERAELVRKTRVVVGE